VGFKVDQKSLLLMREIQPAGHHVVVEAFLVLRELRPPLDRCHVQREALLWGLGGRD